MHNFWKNHQKIVEIMRKTMKKISSHLDNPSMSYEFFKWRKKLKTCEMAWCEHEA
jgi:hypothetical protein